MANPRRLIVNADDLGLHPLVNQAVFFAHREGIVTSTTILTGGAAFHEAVEGLKQHPNLGVGLHICLIDQPPVSGQEKIPSLLDSQGRLWKSHSTFVWRYLLGRISLAEVKAEFEAQLEKALNSGLNLTHFDSHQHLHLLPGIASVVAELGEKFGIFRVRIPADDPSVGLRASSRFRSLQSRIVSKLAYNCRCQFESQGWRSSNHFIGFSRGGHLLKRDWLRLIPRLSDGVTEIMVHPGENNIILDSSFGWKYRWEEELAALVDPEVKSLLEKHGVQLIHFGDLS